MKASFPPIPVPPASGLRGPAVPPTSALAIETVLRLPDAMRNAQATFSRTAGVHAAALFTGAGELVTLREGVGRHNAVDKVLGRALLDDRLPLSDAILLVSGRASFEIMQKSLPPASPSSPPSPRPPVSPSPLPAKAGRRSSASCGSGG